MEHSDSIKEIAGALAKAQAGMKAAQMNATNPFLKNKYADLGAVIDAVRKPLADNGLSITQPVSSQDGMISVTTMLMHASGEWISETISLPMGEERGKSLAQMAGSVITYLRRYSLSSMLGVYADEDTDGNEPKSKAPAEKQPEPPKKATAPANGERPYSPEALRAAIAKGAEQKHGQKASDKQRNLVGSMLSLVFGPDDEQRHAVQEYLTGHRSVKEMSDEQILTLFKWLDPQPDGGNWYTPSPLAAREAVSAYTAAAEAAEQGRLV